MFGVFIVPVRVEEARLNPTLLSACMIKDDTQETVSCEVGTRSDGSLAAFPQRRPDAGRYTLHIMSLKTSAEIKGSPFEITVGNADATASASSDAFNAQSQQGSGATTLGKLAVTDEYPRGAVQFAQEAGSLAAASLGAKMVGEAGEVVACKAVDGANGRVVICPEVPAKAGVYSMHVFDQATLVEVESSPFTVTVDAAAVEAANGSSAMRKPNDPDAPAPPSRPSQLMRNPSGSFQPRNPSDVFGSPQPKSPAGSPSTKELSAYLLHPDGTKNECAIKTRANGKQAFQPKTPPPPGVYALHVVNNTTGEDLAGSPFQIKVDTKKKKVAKTDA